MSADQEQGLRILDLALWRIAHRGDCEYYDDEQSRPTPCDCPRCVAMAALKLSKEWRFHGSHHARTQGTSFPREVKMQAAWMKLACGNQGGPDHLLQRAILNDEHAPSARDWYVATSVVQWLATNVGMTVLEAAGFEYRQWDQDRATSDLLRQRAEREAPDPRLGKDPSRDEELLAAYIAGANDANDGVKCKRATFEAWRKRHEKDSP